jgi:hypothetical protein
VLAAVAVGKMPLTVTFTASIEKKGYDLVLSPRRPGNSRRPWKQSMVQGMLQPISGEKGSKQANQSTTEGDSLRG